MRKHSSNHGQRKAGNGSRKSGPVNTRNVVSIRPGNSPTFDLIFENHFSLFLIRPASKIGQQWLDENVGDSETQTWCGAVVCEPRYVEQIYFGAVEAGLAVSA